MSSSDGVVSAGCAVPAVLLPPSEASRDSVISSGQKSSGKKQPPFQRHYNELLQIIGEIGKDVKPAYTSNKISTDKLRKNIMLARTVLRDCQADLEKLGPMSHD